MSPWLKDLLSHLRLPLADSRQKTIHLSTELLDYILYLSTPSSRRAFMQCSHFFRQLAIPHVFRSVAVHREFIEPPPKLPAPLKLQGFQMMNGFTSLDPQILSAVKNLTITLCYWPYDACLENSSMLDAIAACKHIQSFSLLGHPVITDHMSFALLLDALRNAGIRNVRLNVRFYDGSRNCTRSGRRIIQRRHRGLSGLRALHINFGNAYGISAMPNSLQLNALLLPSLSTLVELSICIADPVALDIHGLEEAGHTLRILRLKTTLAPCNNLEAICSTFPNLTELFLVYLEHGLGRLNPLWDPLFTTHLLKLPALERFVLPFEFEHPQASWNGTEWQAHRDRAFTARLQTTREIAARCPNVQQCIWTRIFFKMSWGYCVSHGSTATGLDELRGIEPMSADHTKELVSSYWRDDRDI